MDRTLVDAALFGELTHKAGMEMQPDVDLEVMDLGLTLLRAASRLQQDLETRVHRPAGMTWAAFRVLFVIRAVGPTSPREIAHLSSISTASASSVLNTLERYGMITRQRDVRDGRGVLISLTPAGTRATAELFVRNNNRVAEWLTTFSDEERQTLLELLRRLLEIHTPPPADGDVPLAPIRKPHETED